MFCGLVCVATRWNTRCALS